MGLQILLLRINFGYVLMVAARRFVLAIFVPTAMSLTMVIRTFGYPATSTRLQLLFSGILVLVLLLMVIDYFNYYVSACSLGTAAQIKIMGESSLVFTGLWFGFL
jgi:hypothetical protein